MHRMPALPALVVLLATAGPAAAPAQPAPGRGQLLYETHCIECHTRQVHWRTLRLARNWDTLRAQVARWQAAAWLQWGRQDIDAVARHLNETMYQFPVPQARR